jgi:two-component system chemotaxis sensor kinase CheA
LLDFMAESLDLLMDAERIALGGIPDAEGINAIFRAFHTIKGMASYLSQPLVETDAHTIETRLLPLRDGERPFGDDDRAYILTSVDRLRTTIACLTDTPAVPRIGDVLVAEGVPRAAVEETARHLKPGQRLGDALIEEGKATKAQVEQAVQVQHQVAKPAVDGFSRVATSKLEDLMNLVGELLISQAQIVHDPDLILGTRLQQEAVRQSRIIRDVQLLALSLRMVPLRGTFQKLARAVHDTARKVNKEVEFTVQGEDTEVDRTLAETIADPLLHMVRNGVDHGLETAEVRLSRGKSAQGNLRLAACHAGDHVVITLADDGNGMDPARLRAKAVEKGLIAADAVLTDHQAYDLIFAPGFSTAAAVTNVSGRGVGMDVVRRAVESAKGSISIDSVLGRGSTFTIRLPLTTAILDAMVLRIGKQHYLLPISAIVEAVRPGPAQVQSLLGRERILQSRGRSLPIVHLGSLFGIPDTIEDPCSSIMLVIEDGARGLALQACEIIGQQQVVIKPLSQAIRHHPGVSGTAILGDGRVGLILDPTRLSGP